MLIFPSFPALGGISLIIIAIVTWWQKYKLIIANPLNWGLAILSFWLIIISCLAAKPAESFLGLANLVLYFFFFSAFRIILQKPAQLRQLAWILVLGSVLPVILGLGQILAGWHSPMLIFGWELVANGNPTGRMASTFMYANIFAAYLLLVLVFALGLWLDTYRSYQQQKTRALSFLTITIISVGICLILTSSRNAWAIAFLAGLAFALYLRWYWLVGIVVAGGTAVLGASFGPISLQKWLRPLVPPYLWTRLADELYPNRPLPTLRTTQWQFCWNLTLERPWTGWGLRNFTPLYETQMNVWLGHPHNLFLMLTAETGFVATFLLCAIVGWILARAVIFLANKQVESKAMEDKLILYTYLVAFAGLILFNCLDVTLFDFRLNTLGWLLLAAIAMNNEQ